MRPNTSKRAAQMRVYRGLRRVYLEDHPACEFPIGCDGAATEIHHKRGRVGADLIDVTRWAGLCHDHHAYVTEHPTEAYELGISERRIGVAS